MFVPHHRLAHRADTSRVPLRVFEGVVRDDHTRLLLQAFLVPGACVNGGRGWGRVSRRYKTLREGVPGSEMGEMAKRKEPNSR